MSETAQTSNFTPVVLEGGFLPSTRFLSSANIKKYEAVIEVVEDEDDKHMADKHKVPETESETESALKMPKYEEVISKPAITDAPKIIEDKTVAAIFSEPVVTGYNNPKDEIKVNEKREPTASVYSRPLLPLPRNFGFRLSEVLDLEQRLTEANFPTISTFTENFEDDIDWDKGKSNRVKRSEETQESVPSSGQFKVGKWKIKSQSLDGKSLDVKEWIIPKDVPKEEVIKHGSYDMLRDLVNQGIIDLGKESIGYIPKIERVEPYAEPCPEGKKQHMTSFGKEIIEDTSKVALFDLFKDSHTEGKKQHMTSFGKESIEDISKIEQVESHEESHTKGKKQYMTSFGKESIEDISKVEQVGPYKESHTEGEKQDMTSFEEFLTGYNYDQPISNNDIPNKSFEEIMNSYASDKPYTNNEETPIKQISEIEKPQMQSFHNFLLESNQKPRHGKYQRPNILNAFELENPSAASAGRQFLPSNQRNYLYPFPGVQSAENSYRNHAGYRMTDYRQGDTEVPWQQSGQSSQLHYTVAERRILNTDDSEENPLRFKSKVMLVNNGTGPQVIIVPRHQGLEDITLNGGQTLQTALQETDDKTQNLIDLLDTISGGDDDVVRVRDESFFIKDEYFSDKNFLKNMLEELNSEAQLKKLNLLKESITQKTALVQADRLSEANARLTNVGISLHKQGQVLEHVQRQTDNFTDETPSNPRPERSEATVNKGTDSDRALTLLRRRNRLESILNKLSYLVGSQNNLKPLQQTIKLQEERLVRS